MISLTFWVSICNDVFHSSVHSVRSKFNSKNTKICHGFFNENCGVIELLEGGDHSIGKLTKESPLSAILT